MKTKEELNALKEEVENVNRKLHELSEEELEQVKDISFLMKGDMIMDKEKMNGRELTEKEMEQARGGMDKPEKGDPECLEMKNGTPCVSDLRGKRPQCATCPKSNE